jgi:hypothetical protein
MSSLAIAIQNLLRFAAAMALLVRRAETGDLLSYDESVAAEAGQEWQLKWRRT